MCKKVVAKILPIALAVAGVATGNPALISAGVSAYGTQQQAKSAKTGLEVQKQATATADSNAKAALAQQEQETNRANAKAPNVAALLSKNTAEASMGGTQLTGIGGVKKSDLQLGKNTLLGA